ncbi:MAG: hypothetical protein FD171_73 [Actinobacteria bacterium]|nr:MAG: hypothetical protein FD171_73 [Actinomycetota bacterium]
MTDEQELFTLSAADTSQARRLFRTIAADLFARLPSSAIEHVGSTAVAGSLTKGDLDVLVRVGAADFLKAQLVLDELLIPSSRNERTLEYAEYDYSVDGASVSIQLVVVGSDIDNHFHYVKAALESDSDALNEYNDLKSRYVGRSMASYRQAKERFIDSLLAAYLAAHDQRESILLPGIHE